MPSAPAAAAAPDGGPDVIVVSGPMAKHNESRIASLDVVCFLISPFLFLVFNLRAIVRAHSCVVRKV